MVSCSDDSSVQRLQKEIDEAILGFQRIEFENQQSIEQIASYDEPCAEKGESAKANCNTIKSQNCSALAYPDNEMCSLRQKDNCDDIKSQQIARCKSKASQWSGSKKRLNEKVNANNAEAASLREEISRKTKQISACSQQGASTKSGRGKSINDDRDDDGVLNNADLCSAAPNGPVHQTGEWAGCSGGQNRDRDLRKTK